MPAVKGIFFGNRRDGGIQVNFYPEEIRGAAKRAAAKGLRDGLKIARKAARDLAPVDDNSLHALGLTDFPAVHHRMSIKSFVKLTTSSKKKYPIRAGLITTSNRGWWIEAGTVKMSPIPHLYPAVMQNRDAILAKLRNKLDDVRV